MAGGAVDVLVDPVTINVLVDPVAVFSLTRTQAT
jgi:hypothetical protein